MNCKKCCVIGSPIAHSLSPIIHHFLYKTYSIDCIYEKIEVRPGTIDQFITEIPVQNICGFNITMPLKTEILPYLANKSTAKSINTVVVKNGALYGYSTDEDGFFKSLQEKGFTYENMNIVFIGAGAVTNALALDAASKNAKSITIINRTLSSAKKIADHIGGQALSFNALNEYPCISSCDILINTTPLGMKGCGEFESFDFLRSINPDALVCDLIYNPNCTNFLKQAGLQGNKTLGGLSMLIWQALFSFRYFFGIMPTAQDKNNIMEEVLHYLNI